MPENRWYIESKMREMSPKRVTLSTLHGFRYPIWTNDKDFGQTGPTLYTTAKLLETLL